MEKVLPRAIGAPPCHQRRSLRCPRPHRTLRSRRARPDPHESPLLCGRRQRQLFCSRGAPAAEGVEARGGRGRGYRHVLHAIGSVASVGPNGRHAASASAGRLRRRRRCAEPLPAARWRRPRCRCRLARCRLVPAPAPKGPTPPPSSASAVSSSRRTRSVGASVAAARPVAPAFPWALFQPRTALAAPRPLSRRSLPATPPPPAAVRRVPSLTRARA